MACKRHSDEDILRLMHEIKAHAWACNHMNTEVSTGSWWVEKVELQTNQSTYIPQGNKHRLENPENELLIIIEVQLGSYLGEDDIVRYEDGYGRR